MRNRFFSGSFLLCFALCLTTAAPVFAQNLLDVVEAAQNTIEKKYSNPDSIARKMALEELEKIARSDISDDQIVKAILEKYPETSVELATKSDLNSNGIPDAWEKKFKITAAAPDSDEDADGFCLLQEYKAGTDPLDPLSHPKYITQIYVSAVSRQRLADLSLISVDMANTNDKNKWVAAFNVVQNGTEKVEFVGNKGVFSNDNDHFRVVDFEIDEKTQKPIAYIQRFERAERIPCRLHQPVFDSVLQVKSLNSLNGRTFISQVGGTFQLGSKRTGEEIYKIVSADPDTKITIFESVGDKPETFKIPPLPGSAPAAKSAPKNASAKSSAPAKSSEKSASSAKKAEE